MPSRNPLIIAHGGFAGQYPNNTLPAINAAIALGVDYVEVDLNLSKDDEVMVIHDSTVDRTTNGEGRVRDLTLKQLKALDAGSWFHDRFSGVQIPTLEEILPLFKNSQSRLCLEFKLNADGQADEGIESRVVDLVRKHGLLDRIIVTSFSKNVLRQIKTLEPGIPTSYDPCNQEYEACSVRQLCLLTLSCGSHILSCRHKVIDEDFVTEPRLLGVRVWAWTVNDPDRMRYLISVGVDGILTDQPDQLKNIYQNQSLYET